MKNVIVQASFGCVIHRETKTPTDLVEGVVPWVAAVDFVAVASFQGVAPHNQEVEDG